MKLNLREPSFFIGHRGSVPLCPSNQDARVSINTQNADSTQ